MPISTCFLPAVRTQQHKQYSPKLEMTKTGQETNIFRRQISVERNRTKNQHSPFPNNSWCYRLLQTITTICRTKDWTDFQCMPPQQQKIKGKHFNLKFHSNRLNTGDKHNTHTREIKNTPIPAPGFITKYCKQLTL